MRKIKPDYDPKDPHVRGADSPTMTIGDAFRLAANLGSIVDTAEGKAILLDMLPLKTGGYKVVCRLLATESV